MRGSSLNQTTNYKDALCFELKKKADYIPWSRMPPSSNDKLTKVIYIHS